MSKSKKLFKEKIVQFYEALLQNKNVDPTHENQNFWNEFFLLKANGNILQSLVQDLSGGDDVAVYQPRLGALFDQSVVALMEDNQIKVVNALITLFALIRGVLFQQSKHQEYLELMLGTTDSDLKLQILNTQLCQLLVSDIPKSMVSLILKIYLTMVSSCDEIKDNTLVGRLMCDELFDACMHILARSELRQQQGYQVVLLLNIFVSYKRRLPQQVNPFTARLSILDDEVVLNGYGRVVSVSLLDFNRLFYQAKEEQSSGGLFSALTSMVGSMFVTDEACPVKERHKPSSAMLLAFYNAIHLNRNFISLLTNSQTETISEPLFSSSGIADGNSDIKQDAIQNPPSNLLVTFLEFCSIVMLYTKDDEQTDISRLCFIILTCISEDQCANAIMHDINIVFKVQLHRMPMRHRKICDETSKPLRPLAYAVLDLMVEFIVTHLRKTFLLDLYTFCIGVIRRLLCYQKRCKIRFNYSWKDLWSSLIALLKFLTAHESDLSKRWNIFALALQAVNIFNLFITFGDTFLPSPQAYDDLYYEIIRMHTVFDNLYAMALRHGSIEGAQHKDIATRLLSSLINVKAIITHFNSKLESWSVANETASLTEEEVLEVIRNNYDTLTLKLQDGLDMYESYSPDKPKESLYFNHVIKNIISDYRDSNLEVSPTEQQNIMQEIISYNA